MEVVDIIKKRRSIKEFSSKKPDWRAIIDAIDCARYAPMAGNNYTLKFILIDDKEKIAKLAEYAQQDFIAKASYVVVVCSDPTRAVNLYGERGKRYLKQQAGAAIENFLLRLTDLGLATCWIGHFDDELVKELLEIPEDIEVEAFFPIGYPQKEPQIMKHKIDLNNILYFNKYKNKKMKSPKKKVR